MTTQQPDPLRNRVRNWTARRRTNRGLAGLGTHTRRDIGLDALPEQPRLPQLF